MDVVELRASERFIAKEAIAGSFGSASVFVLNISNHGLMIEHEQPLRVATKGRMWFKHGDVVVAVQAAVVWSHLSKEPNATKLLYHSGLRTNTETAELAMAINGLLKRGIVARDPDSLKRKLTKSLAPKPVMPAPKVEPEVTPAQALVIHHALVHFKKEPTEARRWYEKVKDTAPDDVVKYGREVMAVWSYLDRSVDAGIIARCLGK
jgi:PilZ domain-containing protein